MRVHAGIFLCLFGSIPAADAALTCVSSAVPAMVTAEGLAERVGDIVLSCSGGTAGQVVTGNLTLFLSVGVTNRVTDSGRTDIALNVDNGSASPLPAVYATVMSNVSVAFNGVSFALSPAGAANLRVSNLRGAIAQQTLGDIRPIGVSIGFNGPLAITNPSLSVALPNRGLLSSSSSATIYCVGSKAPATSAPGVAAFLAAGTAYHSTRFTEGWANAFQPRSAGTDSGTRVMARYSGLPTGAHLYVPDFVAGTNAVEATAGGDLGQPPSGGRYVGGSGALLLALVRLTDSNGAGGVLYTAPPSPGVTASFDSVSEVPIQNGTAVVVYEVLASNPTQQESAQFPAFLVFTPPEGGSTALAKQEVSFAPLSTVAMTSTTAPVPRYLLTPPPSDCSALRDCDASYFPRLLVRVPPLNFRAVAGSAFQYDTIGVRNDGGGVLNWFIAINYRNGSGWLRVDPPSGQGNTAVTVYVMPDKLTPGVYEADLTIDAGPLVGSRTARVRLEVTPFVPPPPDPPAIRSAVNAATFQAGPLAPGSIATLFGVRFGGANLSVTIDGLPARVLFSRDDQINLLVPAELAGRTTARLVVRAGGLASQEFAIALASVAPGIFGLLNQDYSINSATNGAPVGSVIQIFATGLPENAPDTVLARVHDRAPAPPLYAGPAPGFPGVQQVNVLIPDDLPAMTTEIRVCARPPERPTDLVCSPPVKITLR